MKILKRQLLMTQITLAVFIIGAFIIWIMQIGIFKSIVDFEKANFKLWDIQTQLNETSIECQQRAISNHMFEDLSYCNKLK